MKRLSLLTLFILFISCKKEIKLMSCDMDVYHKDNISDRTLESLSNRAFFEKGWRVNYMVYKNRNEVEPLAQHAFLDYSVTTKEQSLYKYVSTCKATLRVSFPEVKKKSFMINKESSEITPGLHHCVPGGDYYCEKVEKTCNENALSIIDELPSCTLR